MTGPDVSSAAARYLDPERMLTLVVGDYAAIRESLATLGLGAPQVLPIEV